MTFDSRRLYRDDPAKWRRLYGRLFEERPFIFDAMRKWVDARPVWE